MFSRLPSLLRYFHQGGGGGSLFGVLLENLPAHPAVQPPPGVSGSSRWEQTVGPWVLWDLISTPLSLTHSSSSFPSPS